VAAIKLVTEKQQTIPYVMCVTKRGLDLDWSGRGSGGRGQDDKLSEWMTISICVVKSAVNALQDAKNIKQCHGISWDGQLEYS